ncbi:uncharacterized protein LOC110414926 isoform X2 [Herrania umbratica]|uniref:Uncharacterized protein LOC110414926 isoform X2 n=1 Tax=Herrania umbratica TaxID=108875 RepID=A0A6J1A4T2_9ROSI|nr:uncharacterized protein LOC110414926 isoform X2 [Herrania umbratica]
MTIGSTSEDGGTQTFDQREQIGVGMGPFCSISVVKTTIGVADVWSAAELGLIADSPMLDSDKWSHLSYSSNLLLWTLTIFLQASNGLNLKCQHLEESEQ